MKVGASSMCPDLIPTTVSLVCRIPLQSDRDFLLNYNFVKNKTFKIKNAYDYFRGLNLMKLSQIPRL